MSRRKGCSGQKGQSQLGCQSHLCWVACQAVHSAGDKSQILPWVREGGLTEVGWGVPGGPRRHRVARSWGPADQLVVCAEYPTYP